MLTARNRSRASRPIQVRVGIHVGDVIHQDGDVLGDAVNIASPIEPLAEAGGVCLSGPVADQVSKKIPFRLLPLEHAFLKNIDSPIAIFEVGLPWHARPAWQFSGAASGVQDLRESLRLWTNVAWPAERLRVLMDMGALEAELGDIASALETYREAQTVATRLGDPGDAGRSRTRVQQREFRLSEARSTDSRREVERA